MGYVELNRMKRPIFFPILALVIAFDSNGMLAATREQILCNSTHIVVGEITTNNIECENKSGYTQCNALLTAKINRVIATAKSSRGYPNGVGIKDVGVEPGNTLDLRWWYPNGFYLNSIIENPSAKTVSRALKRESLIFSIDSGYGLWLGTLPINKESEHPEAVLRVNRPFYTSIWGMEKLEWVTKAIQTNSFCSEFELHDENRQNTAPEKGHSAGRQTAHPKPAR